VVLRNYGVKTKYPASEISSVYFAGLIYESVSMKKDKWVFMIKDFYGDVIVYRYIRDSDNSSSNLENLFFRQKAEPKGEVHLLSEKNLKKISTYSCKPVMDSLLAKKDWSTVLTEMLKNYNTRCAEIKGSN